MTYKEWLHKENLKCIIDKDYFKNSGGLYVSERDQYIQIEVRNIARKESDIYNSFLYKEYEQYKLKKNISKF